MVRSIKLTLAFVVGVAIAGLLGTVLSTQFVLAELASLQVNVPMSDRIDTTTHDLLSMGPIYTVVIGIGFLVAFVVARLLLPIIRIPRPLAFGLAGFAAVTVSIWAMSLIFGTMLIPAAREMTGYITLGAAGALGGMFYAWLTPDRTA